LVLTLSASDRAEDGFVNGGRESEFTFLRDLQDELGGAGSTNVRSPLALFRSVMSSGVPVHDGRPLVEVVGLPSHLPSGALRAGDWMVRATPGTGDPGHLSVLASGDLLSPAALAAQGIATESSQPGQYGEVIEAGTFPSDAARRATRRLLDQRGRVPPHTLFLRPTFSPPPPGSEEPQPDQNDQTQWEIFGVADDSPIPPEIAEFASTLGREWSARRNGSPPVDQMIEWLVQDYRNTLEGAHRRFGSRVSDDSVGRAWMVSRREQMGFQLASSAGVAALGNFQPPSQAASLVSDSSLIEGSDRAPVAPTVIRFVQELRRRYVDRLHVSTYRGHGGGAFLDRGYSIDLFLNGSDSRRFYPPETSIRFLRAVTEAAGATDSGWRIIYNDFSVADAINRETGRRHVIFVGSATFDRNRNVTGLNWHGPEPLILHLHLDLVPGSNASAGAATASAAGAVATALPPGDRASPSAELVTFSQNVLRVVEGEQVRVDGVLGPLTRAALERFRRKYSLGTGGTLDERTQLALAQRALEEIQQRSLFAQPGVLDAATREALLVFKAAHGLASDPLMDPLTRAALARALAARPAARIREGGAADWAEDVPSPSGGRPGVLSRGATHPAVGEAQRKLNAFHRYRVAAGLDGLREGPVDEDNQFGRRTFEAVRWFQELVFPGDSAAQNGSIEARTWEQLDAIELGPGSPAVAQVTVDQLVITTDRFGTPLRWDDVIGLDTEKLNLQVVAWGLPPATMPVQVRVELTSRLPNHSGGSPTLTSPVLLDVARFGLDASKPRRTIYRLGRPVADIGGFLRIGGPIKKVASVVRIGGTSDLEFRRVLGWQLHGHATQPTSPRSSSGVESTETPDARALFRAAGVEVLQVSVAPLPNWRLPGPLSRLVRSPAKVLYYSGHGRSSGMLGLELDPKECPDVGPLADWLGAPDLVAAWPHLLDLDVLILAGCAVLKMGVRLAPFGFTGGPGQAWSRLLAVRGGPLQALLGYGGSAPCDNNGGDVMARAMAARLAAGSTDYARDWVTINADHRAWNAVAMDGGGYWIINRHWPTRWYSIEGPLPIT
jgi:peptidoglycan hydrolase-like protein with peptidoglycan-binding domain